jgi:hypothetical protein
MTELPKIRPAHLRREAWVYVFSELRV